jgi:2-C-methyl-D-erythritol 4-phosphate cytidylyltransferase
MVEWSLEAFRRAEGIGPIVVAVPPGLEAPLGEGVVAVAGGRHRSASVAAALARVETELVAVHDAARPLVTAELIDDLIEELSARPEASGVIAAAPLIDTVKRARAQRPARGELSRMATVARTVRRDHLWAAQTPQVFRVAALREAFDADPHGAAAATDESMLVEKAGGEVLIRPSSPENLKVTTPLDLRLAELLLAQRKG